MTMVIAHLVGQSFCSDREIDLAKLSLSSMVAHTAIVATKATIAAVSTAADTATFMAAGVATSAASRSITRCAKSACAYLTW